MGGHIKSVQKSGRGSSFFLHPIRGGSSFFSENFKPSQSDQDYVKMGGGGFGHRFKVGHWFFL